MPTYPSVTFLNQAVWITLELINRVFTQLKFSAADTFGNDLHPARFVSGYPGFEPEGFNGFDIGFAGEPVGLAVDNDRSGYPINDLVNFKGSLTANHYLGEFLTAAGAEVDVFVVDAEVDGVDIDLTAYRQGQAANLVGFEEFPAAFFAEDGYGGCFHGVSLVLGVDDKETLLKKLPDVTY